MALTINELKSFIMNEFNVNGYNIATCRHKQLYLKKLLSGYELNIEYFMRMSVAGDVKKASVSVYSARIYLEGLGELGLSILDKPAIQSVIANKMSEVNCNFSLVLQPSDIERINQLRKGRDLRFKLSLNATGAVNEQSEQNFYCEFVYDLSKSDWLQKLENSKYCNSLLLEVSLPVGSDGDSGELFTTLKDAQEHFYNDKYKACISDCRSIITIAGEKLFGTKHWHGKSLDIAGVSKRVNKDKNRETMAKSDREQLIWASLKHYTQLSHHTKSEGGEPDFTRAEAQMCLMMAALMVSKVS